ncbi:hypothetical protein HRR83_001183 [Exophiala dermatitidis]|uniref:Flavin reductase like domain-containing protein n=1 Tax=Exophiala dermatitidis TaxID=5970 RepID=A0AAN6F1Y2_EXODE|nr:hypothetical protein HRR75_001087 [Exophiala dermatitidis]KAJ4525994.1 hypothetical protein HRR74_001187 [Exophiala dermatitidis]KAJ4527060.1 hypothetical protein HRR73_001857 [Exophiala dermatitidis]KAJ4532778.1 hypothetical protein HRR76_007759 [Exophiala dermatitidis]KAJ4546711.1 hypothetical protein HRR77_004255 [Exophiala dermatitidis]
MPTLFNAGKLANIAWSFARSPRLPLEPQEFQRLCRRYCTTNNGLFNARSHRSARTGPLHPQQFIHRPNRFAPPVCGQRFYSGVTTAQSEASRAANKANSSEPTRADSKLQGFELSDAVRRLMRHVPHPVAVITATDVGISPEGGPRGWRGATVSSFNTVALLPRPVVSFNIKKISSTFDAIRSSGHFYVHLLSEEADEAHRIASKFTKGNASYPFHDDSGELERFALVNAEVQQQTAGTKPMPPILHFENDAGDLVVPFRLQCRYLHDKIVEIGDHVVLFGEVDHVFHDVAAFRDQSPDHPIPCLAYVDGSYCRVAAKAKLS